MRSTLVGGLVLALSCVVPVHARDTEATGILGFASASYSCAKTPRLDEGGIGAALASIPSAAPYRALAYAATQSEPLERLGLVVAVSDFCYAGSYSGAIPDFGWRSLDEQIDNLLERWPQLGDPGYPGPRYVVLGPFNNGLQTAGAYPGLDDPSALLFTDEDGWWVNPQGRDLHFARIDAAIDRLLAAGVYPVVMGYPDPQLVDLQFWLEVFRDFLPPWTEVTTQEGLATIAEHNRMLYQDREAEGILYVPTDDIRAEDIGDGFHLEYRYHEHSAQELAKAIKRHQRSLRGLVP